MSKPRGHSNAYVDRTKPHPNVPDKAMIPIVGGAQVHTVRDLPPLALSREEWKEIGERMKWTYISSDNACHADNLGG